MTVIIAMRLMSHGRCELFVCTSDTCRSHSNILHGNQQLCTTESFTSEVNMLRFSGGQGWGHRLTTKSIGAPSVQAPVVSPAVCLIITGLLMTAKYPPTCTLCRCHRRY